MLTQLKSIFRKKQILDVKKVTVIFENTDGHKQKITMRVLVSATDPKQAEKDALKIAKQRLLFVVE